MFTVNVDANLGKQLAENSTALVCDESGKLLGRFLSEQAYHRLVYDWAKTSMSEEELDRRRNEPGGRTLDEIWKRLGAT